MTKLAVDGNASHPPTVLTQNLRQRASLVDIDRPKRLVTLRRDDLDFVVSFYPEDTIVFRHAEPFSLRNVCAKLRWKIISDNSSASETVLSAF